MGRGRVRGRVRGSRGRVRGVRGKGGLVRVYLWILWPGSQVKSTSLSEKVSNCFPHVTFVRNVGYLKFTPHFRTTHFRTYARTVRNAFVTCGKCLGGFNLGTLAFRWGRNTL